MNDQDYKSVLKEYDYYNSNDNDFEIIDELPDNFMYNPTSNVINNSIKIKDQDKKLKNLIIKIFTIIFNSRNKRSEFSSKSKRKLKDNTNDNSFKVDIEELIEYDNLKAWDESKGEKKKKYIIDFYLYKNNNDNDKDSLKSAKKYEVQKLFVERWKIKYKENISLNNPKIKDYNLYFENKMKIIEKSIVSYSRVLPLYNISKDDNYTINFKFNQNKRKSKNLFIDKDSTQKIKLMNEDIFSFKLSISYLKIKPGNIDYFLNKNSSDFVIIPSEKSRKRFLSDNYKRSSSQLLNNIDQNNKEDKIGENDYINECIKDKRLSYDDNYYKKYINSKFYEEEQENTLNKKTSLSNHSSEDNLSLVICETNNETGQNSKKYKKNNHQKNDEIEFNPKKCMVYKDNSNICKNKGIDNDNLENYNFRGNLTVKSIVQDYKILKKMINLIPDYGNVKYNKLLTFISSN